MSDNIQELKQAKLRWDELQRLEWFKARQMAINYLHAITEDYTKKYFKAKIIKKVPIANVNITKRIIDRISLVFMIPPIRTVADGKDRKHLDNKYFRGINTKMQRVEKLVNLIELAVIHPIAKDGKIEYELITKFVPIYDDDPLVPVGITYPLNDPLNNMTTEMWAYCDEETTFKYNFKSNLQEKIDQRDHKYGLLPFHFAFKEGVPEERFLNVDIDWELITTNLELNMIETSRNANIQFQSFGWMWATGYNMPKDLTIGPEVITKVGEGGSMGVLSPPDTAQSVETSINGKYKRLAQNKHLSVQFVDGTTAESGVAIRLRNQELQDERSGDVVVWRQVEEHLFEINKAVAREDLKKNIGEDFQVDFNETQEILSTVEQDAHDANDIKLGLIDNADILMRRDPDKFPDREAAIAHLALRGFKDPDITNQTVAGGLLDVLNKPVPTP